MSSRWWWTTGVGAALGFLVDPFTAGGIPEIGIGGDILAGIVAALLLEALISALVSVSKRLGDGGALAVRAVVYSASLGALVLWLGPMVGDQKASAKSTSCLSNLKQMGIAFEMYSQDTDQRYPPAAKWMDVIEPLMKEDLRSCPEVQSGYGYAMSRFMDRAMVPVKDAQVLPLLFESKLLGRNESEFFPSLPMRHPNRPGAVLFADGHARR